MSKNKKRKFSHRTTKNTNPKKSIKISSYEHLISDYDKKLDTFGDILSPIIRYNWKNYGVVQLDNSTKSVGERFSHDIKYKTEMFRKYGSKDRFFHITSPLNSEKILLEGLKGIGVRKNTCMGKEGEIFLVESDNEIIWNYIGYGQLCVGINNLPFVVLEIDKKGLNGKLFSENCNDFPSPLHTVVEQDVIEPQWIKKISELKTSRQKFYESKEDLKNLKQEYFNNHYTKGVFGSFKNFIGI